MSVQIKLETFAGPMDLLLHLIEKAEVDIYDIPISEITDQYINIINEFKELNMETVSEFLLMAATLIEIKSKMLLPVHKKKNSDEEDIDPREELVRRLIEYKQYKLASEDLKDRFAIYEKAFFKEAEPFENYILSKDPLKEMELSILMEGVSRILTKLNKKKKYNAVKEIRRDRSTVEEQLRFLESFLMRNRKIFFDEIFEECENKYEIVVTFLAMLEMMKRKKIHVIQENTFDRIKLEYLG